MAEGEAKTVELHHVDEGDGPPVLLLHALAGDHRGLEPVSKRLASRWRCLRMDLRGSGHSPSTPPPYTTSLLAADVEDTLQSLGLGPVHVVGTSTGGAVAQELALAHPERVASLTLVSTWGARDAWLSAVLDAWARQRPHLTDEDFYPAIAAWAFTHQAYDHGLYELMRDAMREDPLPQPIDGFVGQATAARDHDPGARLGEVTAPTLVVVGEDDVLTPSRLSRDLAGLIPDARLHVVPALGHALFAEDPAAFVDVFEEWLTAGTDPLGVGLIGR